MSLWDIHHPYRFGESIEETFSNLRTSLRHVHLKDARRVGENWELVLFDEGEVPWRETVKTLIEAGYDGALSVEWERKWHPEIEEAETALPKHLSILRKYLTTIV